MKSDSPATAAQIQQVAKLLGLAVLRWQRERERSEKLSNSLPGRLELSPENSLSVTGRRDPATCSVVASSESEIGSERLERRTQQKSIAGLMVAAIHRAAARDAARSETSEKAKPQAPDAPQREAADES